MTEAAGRVGDRREDRLVVRTPRRPRRTAAARGRRSSRSRSKCHGQPVGGAGRARARGRAARGRAAARRAARWRRSCRWLEPSAVALDNALRLQRAEALSVTDDLTRLYNSRYLHQVAAARGEARARAAAARCRCSSSTSTGSRAINDRYGHLCGSRALVEAAGGDPLGARARPTSWRGSAATSSRSCCPTPAREGAVLGRASASATGSPTIAFLAGDGLEHPADGVGRRRHAARRRRVTPEELLAGGRRGDVPGQGRAARTGFELAPTADAGRPTASRARVGVLVEPSFDVLAVLQRSGHRPRHGQHLRLRAREGHRRQRAVDRRDQQGQRPRRGGRQGSQGDARPHARATSSPSSR